jgi:hypothetical protein
MQLTDELLRFEIGQGLKQAQIAVKYGVSRQAIHQRVKALVFTTTTIAVIAPLESRQFVAVQLDAMEELGLCVHRVKLLQDACDTWLRDANDPTKYDIGPRGDEVKVTYWEPGDDGEDHKAKASLQSLLRRVEDGGFLTVKHDTHTEDPRNLILKTASEVRQTVGLAVQLAQMLADARAMQSFREAMLSAIAKVSPEVAQSIAESVRSVLLLHHAAGGPGSLAS